MHLTRLSPLFFLWPSLLAAQDGLTTAPVVVTAPRVTAFAAGLKLDRLDSARLAPYRRSTLADALVEQSPVVIKSYGVGGLATPAFRGTSANHTGLLWNGIALNSAQNGQLDLNLIPLLLVDEVQVQYGPAAALQGSGFVGGSILMSDRFAVGTPAQLRFSQAVGSFGRTTTQGRYDWGGSAWRSSTRAFYSRVNNNFPFQNNYLYGAPHQRLAHAGQAQWAVLQAGELKLSSHHTLRAWLWQEHTERDFAGPISDVRPGTAAQRDDNLRAALQWQWFLTTSTSITTRSAYLREGIAYNQNPALQRWDAALLQAAIQEVEVRRQQGAWQLGVGLNYNYYTGKLDTAISTPGIQRRLAAVAMAAYSVSRFKLDASLRQEWFNGTKVPLIPALGVQWQPLSFLRLRANVAGAYRLPTLNDLYWRPGGNPNLQPEQGWSADAGITARLHGWQLQLAGYSTQLHNWILWSPQGSYYSPRNLWRVQVQGLEATLSTAGSWGKLTYNLQATYAFTAPKLTASANPQEVGQPLPYVPRNQGQALLRIKYKRTAVQYAQQAVGARTAALGLPPPAGLQAYYSLTSLSLSQELVLGSSRLELALRLQNLYDTHYMAVDGYATPGRNYLLTLSYFFN